MNLTKYQSIIFDCDGVILNSNKVKTDAFFKSALSYGNVAAQQLVDYHMARGGISRYKKFEWFLQTIVPDAKETSMDKLLQKYAAEVKHGLLTCEVAAGLEPLKAQTPKANWLIVSGGDQQELREVFSERKLAHLFDGGIFGSPDTKEAILHRELNVGNILAPALFIGDSKYDYISSKNSQLDFLFLSGWTEFKEWKDFFINKKIISREKISDLLKNDQKF